MGGIFQLFWVKERRFLGIGPPPTFCLFMVSFGIVINFPGGSDGKESVCNAGHLGSIPGLGRSLGEGNRCPLQLFWPGESHEQRNLVGYSP